MSMTRAGERAKREAPRNPSRTIMIDTFDTVLFPVSGLKQTRRAMSRRNAERAKLLRSLSRYNLAMRRSTSRGLKKS